MTPERPPLVWRWKDDLAQVESPDRVAVLDLEQLDRPPIVLADSAAVIWDLLDGRLDDEEIVGHVALLFSTDESSVRTSVTTFLRELSDLALIVQVPRQ